MRAMKLGFAICALVLGSVSQLPAAIVTFYGIDAGAGPVSPRPNSNATAASFDAAAGALGTINLIDFESAPVGNFASLGIAPGVTATLTGTDTGGGILSGGGDAVVGYNTTSGGSRYLQFMPIFDIGTASVGFSFTTPVQAFGTYITGLGTANGNLTVQFFDGSSQNIAVTGDSSGGALFFGFTDVGASISSITMSLTGVTAGSRDLSSFDDIRYVAASPVGIPEPGSLTLLGLGIAGMIGGAVRNRRRD